jgi:hypothetical protein
LLESQLEDRIVGPIEGSQAATAPTTDAGHGDGEADADVDTKDDDFIRSWARAGFKTDFDDSYEPEAKPSDEAILDTVNIHD